MIRLAFALVLMAAGPAGAQAIDGVAYYIAHQAAEAQAEDGNDRAAYDRLAQLNKQYPDDPESWRAQARLAASLEMWPEAAAAYEQALALGVRNPFAANYHLAQAYAQAGETEAALTALQRAIDAGLDRRYELIDEKAFAALRGDPRFIEMTGLAPEPLDDRAERWSRDIDFLVAEAQRMHASPDRPAFSSGFLEAAETLKGRIGALTDAEMATEIQRLVVLLGDGHTYSRGQVGAHAANPIRPESRALPVVFHPFSDDIYIINGTGPGAALVGGRVTAFGDVPVTEFIDRARAYIHHDNPESWKFLGVHFGFRFLSMHHAAGSAENGAVTISYETPDGDARVAKLAAGDYHQFPRKLRPMPGQEQIPPFLRHVDRVYGAQRMPERGLYYAQINNIMNADDGEDFAAFTKRMTGEALDGGFSNLVVDFRLNNGGNNGLCRPLLRNLIRFETAAPENRVWMITRHETFSAAQNCSNLIEAFTDAIFVGEPSSSSPNFTGEESETMLPYSGLILSISNRYWQNSDPTDTRAWIAPDVPVMMTFEDYAAGRDPALDAISRLVGRR